jgi:uncharacterized protein (TIGR03437 family)
VQLNVIAPFGLQPGGSVNLQVWHYGIPSARIPLPVVSAAPAFFTRSGTGSGNAAVINQNGSVNAPSPPGRYVTLFGTGGGAVEGAIDGTLARSAKSLGGTARVFIGGREAQISYAGAAPQLPAGVFQVNVLVPADTPPGNSALTMTVNGLESPKGVTLEIR